MPLKQMTSIGYLSNYHIIQTDQNLPNFQIKITPSEKQGRTYPIYLSARPIKTYQHILYQSIPDEKTASESNLALTLSTYPISQTYQNLSTHNHQPDYTNPF